MWKLWLSLTIVTIVIIITLVLLFLSIKKHNKKNTLGFQFESQIDNKLSIFAKNEGFKFLKGGLFKYSTNQFFEMDGVLIGNKAVYIIEDKYYQGHLYGEAYADQLTLKIGKKEKNINNPLLQNFKHIQHFYKMCGFNVPVFSLLILPSGTTYEIEQLDSWAIVANEDEIEDKFKKVNDDLKEEPNLSFEMIQAVIDAIKLNRATSYKDIKKFKKITHESKHENK
ncbi:NERD domain-containing protein [Mycoplasmopsis adleri]|uniref:NERD domain-containing protein n=1 Tax=Mycoplasmopsis adleri TaxID=51362 RepID=UPI003873C46A